MKLKIIAIMVYAFFLMSINAAAVTICPSQTFLQDTLPAIDDSGFVKFDKVEVEAAYPGGDKAWIQFLVQNLDAGIAAKKRAPVGAYTVIVQFIVNKDGTISDITSLTNHGYGMEAEVIKVLKKSPNWKPAKQNGKTVRAYRKQPVTFQVSEEEKKKKRGKDD
jgi:Gram-negative bacterial TonB protein C-terminal